MQSLGNRALYQSLRASMALTNTAAAEDTMERILKLYPVSEETGNSLLLMGEYLAELSQPTNALAVFQRFEEIFPIRRCDRRWKLAIAHTCEQEQNWPAAIGKYEKWLADFPTNALQPQADYALARANYQAGNETNAFILLTNFVAQFPTNGLAPLASGGWLNIFSARAITGSGKNYKLSIKTSRPMTSLARANDGRSRRRGAAGLFGRHSDYFTKLEEDTNCLMKLRVQATFAHARR